MKFNMSVKEIYGNVNKGAFWVTLITTIVLFVASWIVPPTGEISPSVLQSSAVLIGFGTLATVNNAVDSGKTVSFNHGNTNVTVGDDDK